MRSILERFWAKVRKGAPDECWIWTAATNGNGYGKFGVRAGLIVYAHRFSFELEKGSIPEHMQIDHVCHNRLCVNPTHLRLATSQENNRNGSLRRDNKSGFRGVSFSKRARKWFAFMSVNGKTQNLGSSETKEGAFDIYRRESVRVFGEFANPAHTPRRESAA